MKTKWILVAAVTAAMLTNGCMAFKELSGGSRGSSSDASLSSIESDDAVLAESDRSSSDEPASRAAAASSRMADASSRAAAAADRAAAVAERASMSAEKTETGFHKSLHK